MARSFDGTDDVLRPTASTTAYGAGGDAITVACWVRPVTLALNGRYMEWWSATAADRVFVLSNDGVTASTLRFAVRRQTGNLEIADAPSGTITTGAWQHLCGRRRRNIATDGCEVFHNGTRVGNVTSGDAALDNVGTGYSPGFMGPGSSTAGGVYAEGWGAEFAIWGVALTDAEIAELAAGQPADKIQAGSLLGYWPCWGNDSPEPDRSGQGHDATVTGATGTEHPSPFLVPLMGARRCMAS